MPDYQTEAVKRFIAHHQTSETLIFSGIGLISRGRTSDGVMITCLMRDQTIHDPHIVQLDVVKRDYSDPSDMMYEGPELEAHYALQVVGRFITDPVLYCGNIENCGKHILDLGFSDSFSERLVKICKLLGAEV